MKMVNTDLPKIFNILKKLFPEPKCALHYRTSWQLVVAVILSAQCTDKKVNEVTPHLFKKYPNLDAYVQAKPAEFEQDIYSTGFYRAKTRNILAAAKFIKHTYKGKIPKTIGEMIAIPGVGRKTANVVLGELYGTAEGIAVDTHVIRLAKLLGLTTHTDAAKIEQDLMKIVPKKEWVHISHYLIMYGRKYCPATKHDHTNCPLAQFYSKQ